MEGTLESRLQTLRARLAEASEGRYAPPRIIAVTKTHSAEEILPLLRLGQTEIGENRVQELTEKLPALAAGSMDSNEKFRIHLIGQLQTNKVKYIIDRVCCVQSVDRMALAREIDRRAQAAGIAMPVLLQVSPANEPQKGGVEKEALMPLLREAARMPGLSVRGLMAVMPIADATPEGQAYLDGLFAGMRALFEHVRDEAVNGAAMEELSMGMSGDYLLAARHGATMVRVGSALFGPRNYAPRPSDNSTGP